MRLKIDRRGAYGNGRHTISITVYGFHDLSSIAFFQRIGGYTVASIYSDVKVP
jgi:hypothetical protein